MLFARRVVPRILSSSSSSVPSSIHQFVYNNTKPQLLKTRTMITIAEGVEFDTIAREWRCKWSTDDDKASLVAAQKALNEVLPQLKKVDGVKSVERIVCGACHDFKIITRLPQGEEKFAGWEATEFAPEKDFLEKLRSIKGISSVETQTYTIMPL